MSNYEYDSSPEGDWDDRGELVWNEFDWQQYLKRAKEETGRFVAFYAQLTDRPDRLDLIAQKMGWDQDDWSINDLDWDETDENSSSTGERNSDENGEVEDLDTDPYTLHRHPVYIVTRGLYYHLKRSWELAMIRNPASFSPELSWRYANSLHRGEFDSILALQALDMGDFALAVCHLKSALAAINQSLHLLQKLPENGSIRLNAMCHQARIRLFDQREVCLRIMRDCRDEVRRRFKEGE